MGYLKNLEDKLHKGVIDQRTYEAMKTSYEGFSDSVKKNLDAPYLNKKSFINNKADVEIKEDKTLSNQSSNKPTIEKAKKEFMTKSDYYIFILIVSIVYTFFVYRHPIRDLYDIVGFFFSWLGVLVVPLILAFISTLNKKEKFPKYFMWFTIVLCLLAYLGKTQPSF